MRQNILVTAVVFAFLAFMAGLGYLLEGCARSARGDSVEIRFQTAPDGRQCYMGFQNGELRGMDCSR